MVAQQFWVKETRHLGIKRRPRKSTSLYGTTRPLWSGEGHNPTVFIWLGSSLRPGERAISSTTRRRRISSTAFTYVAGSIGGARLVFAKASVISASVARYIVPSKATATFWRWKYTLSCVLKRPLDGVVCKELLSMYTGIRFSVALTKFSDVAVQNVWV